MKKGKEKEKRRSDQLTHHPIPIPFSFSFIDRQLSHSHNSHPLIHFMRIPSTTSSTTTNRRIFHPLVIPTSTYTSLQFGVQSSSSLTTASSYPDDNNSDDFDIIDSSPFSVPHSMTVTRPPSPSFSFDFSVISTPSPSPDRNTFPSVSLTTSPWPGTSTRDKRYNTIHNSPPSYHALPASSHRTTQTSKSMKCLIPRLWGALSSPTRKGRRKPARRKTYAMPSNFSYADLQPLDGEEGELIDEACYVDYGDVVQSPPKFADLLSRLPPEVAIYALCFLDLSSIIVCQSVSRRWNILANDSAVWRELFYRRQGWEINLERAVARGWTHPALEQLAESPTSPTSSPESTRGQTLGRSMFSGSTPSSAAIHTESLDVLARPPIPVHPFPHALSPWSPEHPSDTNLPRSASVHAPLFLPWRDYIRPVLPWTLVGLEVSFTPCT
ncbi:hypothetical protein B0F90DRAFT_621389 [Multifurca ochricompacta]|uniref:F-box domain-containing protein n=1 Tax=Multifurca ochricompacta TaxID=376703 RepID=A0AAD4QLL3_9AGAM|nr:hypothetical protein B0F90DRAFT_621389 [Multifurca ochricompacta]